MSSNPYKAIVLCDIIETSDERVLLAEIYNIIESYGECFASATYLAKKLKCGRDKVFRCLKILESSGKIVRKYVRDTYNRFEKRIIEINWENLIKPPVPGFQDSSNEDINSSELISKKNQFDKINFEFDSTEEFKRENNLPAEKYTNDEVLIEAIGRIRKVIENGGKIRSLEKYLDKIFPRMLRQHNYDNMLKEHDSYKKENELLSSEVEFQIPDITNTTHDVAKKRLGSLASLMGLGKKFLTQEKTHDKRQSVLHKHQE